MKVKSVLFDKASGSIGGITAAGGQGGTYFKDKPLPFNPDTTLQQAVRAALSDANVAWSNLTTAVRALWTEYGKTCIRKNQVGFDVTLNGWNAFARVYVPFKQATVAVAPLLLARPAGNGYAALPALSLAYDSTAAAVQATNTGDESVDLLVYKGVPSKETINNYGGSFKYSLKVSIAAGATASIDTAPTEGRNWYRFQSYTSDGQFSHGRVQNFDYDSTAQSSGNSGGEGAGGSSKSKKSA